MTSEVTPKAAPPLFPLLEEPPAPDPYGPPKIVYPDCPGGEHERAWQIRQIGMPSQRLGARRVCWACHVHASLRFRPDPVDERVIAHICEGDGRLADLALRVLFLTGQISAEPATWVFRSTDPVDHEALAAERAANERAQAEANAARNAEAMDQARTSLRANLSVHHQPEPDWVALRQQDGLAVKASPPILPLVEPDLDDILPPWEREYRGLTAVPVDPDSVPVTDPGWWTEERRAQAAEHARKAAAERRAIKEAEEDIAVAKRERKLRLRRAAYARRAQRGAGEAGDGTIRS